MLVRALQAQGPPDVFRNLDSKSWPPVTRGHTPRQVRAKDEKEKRYLTGSIQVQTLSCRNRCVHYAELS